MFAQSVALPYATLSQACLFVLRRAPDHDTGPCTDIDAIICSELMLDANRNGIGRQWAGGWGDEGSVGRVQILHPPPGPVGRELGLAATDPRVGFTVDVRMDVPTV